VVGDQLDELLAAVARQLLDPAGDLGVGGGARGARDRLVGDLAGEAVAKRQLRLAGERRGGPCHDEPLVLERVQRLARQRAGPFRMRELAIEELELRLAASTATA
jgi:hypothetical protein